MKDQKHTALPWIKSIQDPADNYAVILNADPMPGGRRARLLTEIAKVNLTIDAGESNARLIAAAPLLLGACKETLCVLGEWDELHQPDNGPEWSHITALRTAIEAAEKE
ncbi:MAG TPA: hypothetical protein VFI02_14105 [Armatimonadota bacterium]|nr:hypothetical protein [Armatimonadota bacterium]